MRRTKRRRGGGKRRRENWGYNCTVGERETWSGFPEKCGRHGEESTHEVAEGNTLCDKEQCVVCDASNLFGIAM